MKGELLPQITRVEDLAAIRGPGPVMVAGPERDVVALLRHAMDTGRVLAMTPPKAYAGGVAVAVSLRPLSGYARPPARRPLPRAAIAGMVGAGVALAAALVWLTIALVAWIAAHIAAVLIVVALVTVAGAVAGPRGCKTVITIIHRH